MMQPYPKVSRLFIYSHYNSETVYLGPTKEGRALELTLNEKTDGLLRGTTAWLSSGLKIQETQCVNQVIEVPMLTPSDLPTNLRIALAAEERKLGRTPSASALLTIEEKKGRLIKRIDHFHKLSMKFLDFNGLDDEVLLEGDDLDVGSDLSAEEEEYRDDDPFGIIRRHPGDEESPSKTRLLLPSAIRIEIEGVSSPRCVASNPNCSGS
jgi:hypothetical protein